MRRLAEEDGRARAELPATVQGCSRHGWTRWSRFQRRLLAHAAVIGRTFWEGALAPVAAAAEGGDLHEALRALRDKDIIVAGRGRALAGEPELAFKHALIRDAAYEMLPKAVRAQKHFEVGALHRAARGRARRGGGRAARRALRASGELGEELGLDRGRARALRAKALNYLEAAGDAATALYSNADAFSHYEAAAALIADEDARLRAPAREARRRRAAARPRRRRDRGLGAGARAPPRARRSRARRRAAPQDRRRRSHTRASASRRSSTTSAAST